MNSNDIINYIQNINRQYRTSFNAEYIIEHYPHIVTQYNYYTSTPINERRLLLTRTLNMIEGFEDREYRLDMDDKYLVVTYSSTGQCVSFNIKSDIDY